MLLGTRLLFNCVNIKEEVPVPCSTNELQHLLTLQFNQSLAERAIKKSSGSKIRLHEKLINTFFNCYNTLKCKKFGHASIIILFPL